MGKLYQHILLAVDFSEKTKELFDKALAMSRDFDAELSLVYAHEKDVAALHLFVDESAYEKVVFDRANERLGKIIDSSQIPESNRYIKIGTPKQVIIDTAKELQCDLIILGSHGRHGLQRILGTTASAVLNMAEMDIHLLWYGN